jgi:hypothetical protein
MVYHGMIQNGAVVFSGPIPLPEGTPVEVVAVPASGEALPAIEEDPLYNMSDLAGETGVADLSINIDHYLYGHPKVNDGR